jgi:hypothetical protein
MPCTVASPKAGAFAHVLGGEERFEDVGQDFDGDAAAVVLDGQVNVVAGGRRGLERGGGCIKGERFQPDVADDVGGILDGQRVVKLADVRRELVIHANHLVADAVIEHDGLFHLRGLKSTACMK